MHYEQELKKKKLTGFTYDNFYQKKIVITYSLFYKIAQLQIVLIGSKNFNSFKILKRIT